MNQNSPLAASQYQPCSDDLAHPARRSKSTSVGNPASPAPASRNGAAVLSPGAKVYAARPALGRKKPSPVQTTQKLYAQFQDDQCGLGQKFHRKGQCAFS